MATYTQQPRRISLSTPLGEDVLLLTSFTGTEELSRLFHFELQMLSEEEFIDPKKIVGKNVTFFVKDASDFHRYFNGYIKRFVYCGMYDRLSQYRAEVVPWFWFLTRNRDCRIFQEKTVPQIIEEVFKLRGFTDFDASGITGSHPVHDYRVQYNESDFQFLSRLMEDEGIFYCFKHENGKHTLMLADQKAAHEDIHEDSSIEFTSVNLSGVEATDQIYKWEHAYEFRSGKVAQNDYDFENPTANLASNTNTVVDLENNDKFELYEYPGHYHVKSDGDDRAKVRIEEEEARHEHVHGESMCRWFSPGFKFKVTRHHSQAEEDKGYLLTVVDHRATMGGAYITGEKAGDLDYKNIFTCVPDSITFRPARSTPKPVVHGSQTAVVVGPAGEEIYTDEHARVKVHFHWDRYGKADENSSCWVRVAQVWAGAKWGGMFIPRVGQEVIVDFLEGNPDQPIITGRVYNGATTPPYELPENKTVTTLKSLSSKGGEGFNEIRFEDKKGEEQLFFHSERNQDVRVKNDSLEWVGNDRHLIVEENQLEHVKGDKHLTVDGDHNEKIKGTLSQTIDSDLQQKVGSNYAVQSGSEIHLKAGMTAVIEAGTSLSLKVGGNAIVIDSSGVTVKGSIVTIDGQMVKIASGPGSPAGSGSGASPDAAKIPDEADVADPGETDEPFSNEPIELSPAAMVLQSAAESGAPFCEQCEAAKANS